MRAKHFCLTIAAALLSISRVQADVVDTQDGRHIEGIARFAEGYLLVKNDKQPAKLKLADVVSFTRDSVDTTKVDAAATHGLMGEFFSPADPNRVPNIGLVAAGAIEWGFERPVPYASYVYTFRLTGFITPPVTGTYHFRGEQFKSVTIGDRLLGKDRAADERGFELEAGKPIKVAIEGARGEGNHYRGGLIWAIGQDAEEPVPQSYFTPPDDFETRLEQSYEKILSVAYGGLKGEYFADDAMHDCKMTRLDAGVVGLMWGNPAALNPDLKKQVAIRWTGKIRSPKTAAIRFGVSNSARLWINGTKIIDAWPGTGNAPREGTFDMKAGEFYDLKLETKSGDGFGQINLVCSIDFAYMPPIAPRYLYPPDDVPRCQIMSPLDGAVVDAGKGLRIRAVVFPGRGKGVKKVEILSGDDKHVVAEITHAPYEWLIHPSDAGEVSYQARVTNSAGIVSLSEPTKFWVISAPDPSLGGEWSLSRIGTSHAPTATLDKDHLQVVGGTGGFSDQNAFGGQTAFSLPMVSRVLRGDGEIVAHLTGLPSTKPGALVYGGITLRSDVRPDSPHVTLLANGKTNWYIDRAFGTGAGSSVEKPMPMPVWLRVTRSGSIATASWSIDGKDWTPAGSATLGDDKETVIGLTALAVNNDASVTADFENMTIRSLGSAQFVDGAAVELTNGSMVLGDPKVDPARVIVAGRDGHQFILKREQVARIFFGPTLNSAVSQLTAGWRGAIIGTDTMEGDISDVTADSVNVNSVIFGIKALTKSDGLLAVVLNDVTPDPHATALRYVGGQSMTSGVRIDNDLLIADDPILGELRLKMADLASIIRPQNGP